jgi:hypothetical protein
MAIMQRSSMKMMEQALLLKKKPEYLIRIMGKIQGMDCF